MSHYVTLFIAQLHFILYNWRWMMVHPKHVLIKLIIWTSKTSFGSLRPYLTSCCYEVFSPNILKEGHKMKLVWNRCYEVCNRASVPPVSCYCNARLADLLSVEVYWEIFWCKMLGSLFSLLSCGRFYRRLEGCLLCQCNRLYSSRLRLSPYRLVK